ncbi:MAG TPA: indolepyruvate ferredoxin oxidoreductase family protein [Rhizomicrobium sp.]
MTLAPVSLDDKFALAEGRIFVSGPQAVVRIAIEQILRDRRAGLKTAGFVSGYRGSPLGGIDNAFWQARDHLTGYDVRFVPGINEEAAATACHGTQQVQLVAGSDYDGVFALWYGKGPGVDRAGDALKHGNLASTSTHGGVLVLVGDDHNANSSTTAHQSEQALVAAMIPILYPASVQEYVDFGILGIAMSRYAGLWVGFKCVNDTADATASVHVGPDRIRIETPTDFAPPPGGLNARRPDNRFDQERRLVRHGLSAAQAFVRANRIDRTVYDSPRRELGVVTAGKAGLDTLQALRTLGIDQERAAALGIRVYKLGMTWPVEPEGLREFARFHREILVVEDKRAFIEPQIRDLLFDLPEAERPRVHGKFDDRREPLLQQEGELNPILIEQALVRRIAALGIGDPALESRMSAANAGGRLAPAEAATAVVRVPFYCSGCPHNTSTRTLADGVTLGGIGCHTLATLMPDRPTHSSMQMGGEGMNWIGMAPFAKAQHVFQNLGDGTYFHSGLLAIRAAVSAEVNITYKLLFNDAVALTGGQPIDGPLAVPPLSFQLWSEGVKKIVVVTDDPDKYPADAQFAPGVTIRHRDDMDAVQRELRDIAGTTVLIYDQVCAAEKRRRRKRNTFPDPPRRVFINELVCEGCGDCGVKSNCVSIQPKETEFGRKRRIDQSSCNKDYSCLNGFCPSFVTVEGGDIVKPGGGRRNFDIPSLSEPPTVALEGAYNILVTGIGGTGVVTVGAILGMAAHIEGKEFSITDMTGLSQKNGAVLSHVRIADRPDAILASSIGREETDLLLACDLLVAGAVEAFSTIRPAHSAAILNTNVLSPAAFVRAPNLDIQERRLVDRIVRAAREGAVHDVNATEIATAALGDSIATNLFMVGYACQQGLLPVSVAAIEQAIGLNGVAVEMNMTAFRLGRWTAQDGAAARRAILPEETPPPAPSEATLADLVARRSAFLAAYQNAAYAQTYRQFVADIAATENRLLPGEDALARMVARYLFKLMAYKDEYEVARLYTDGTFRQALGTQFKGRYRVSFHLAPPLLARRNPTTGEPRKVKLGPWMKPLLHILAGLKGLRGTAFDPFGYTAERKLERRLIADYKALVQRLAAALTPERHDRSVEIAVLPEQIRGYGHVKAASVAAALAEQETLLSRLDAAVPPTQALPLALAS